MPLFLAREIDLDVPGEIGPPSQLASPPPLELQLGMDGRDFTGVAEHAHACTHTLTHTPSHTPLGLQLGMYKDGNSRASRVGHALAPRMHSHTHPLSCSSTWTHGTSRASRGTRPTHAFTQSHTHTSLELQLGQLSMYGREFAGVAGHAHACTHTLTNTP